MISHDRWFLDRIATHILAFEGNSEVCWFEGNYQEYAADFKRRKGVGSAPISRTASGYKKLVHLSLAIAIVHLPLSNRAASRTCPPASKASPRSR